MVQQRYPFQATIYRIWMMRHVNVPDEVARKLASEILYGRPVPPGKKPLCKYIPVVAIVNGARARTMLVPAGAGRFRMQINAGLRKAAHADVGDLVGVELRLDRESRELAVPADLRAGLRSHAKAWQAFRELAPGHRRHMITYFDSAKSPAARRRRIDRIVDALLEPALLGPKRAPSLARNSRAAHRTRIKK
ncbi:MAG: YdeI/OmpD-associated family protein [Candidatus Acidiferrales bacterium]